MWTIWHNPREISSGKSQGQNIYTILTCVFSENTQIHLFGSADTVSRITPKEAVTWPPEENWVVGGQE